jgi:hypothetical protein
MLQEGLWSLPLLSKTVLMESLKGNIVHIAFAYRIVYVRV